MSHRILMIAHSFPPYEYTGVPLSAWDLAVSLKNSGDVVAVVYPNSLAPLSRPAQRVSRSDGIICFEIPHTELRWRNWGVFDSAFLEFHSAEKDRLLREILGAFKPDRIHIMDTVNIPTRWLLRLSEYNIPVVRHVWNAEDLCGIIEPFDPTTRSVSEAPHTIEDCLKHCETQLFSVGSLPEEVRHAIPTALKLKREIVRGVYESVFDLVLFPSTAFKEYFLQTIPVPVNRTRVLHCGVPNRSVAARDAKDMKTIRFVYLGSLTERKGISLLSSVFLDDAILSRTDYELQICGSGEGAMLQELLVKNKRVRFSGAYEPEEIPTLLATADIGLAPSYFETYHRVTREYLAHGLPVIGSNAFGISDAVRDGENGFLFPVGDRKAFLGQILRLLESKDLLSTLSASARQTRMKTLDESTAELRSMCDELTVSPTRGSKGMQKPDIPEFLEALGISSKEYGELALAAAKVAMDEGRKELAQHESSHQRLHNEFVERTEWALRLDAEVRKRDQRIVSLQREFEERSQWALKLDAEVRERGQWALKLDAEREVLEQRIRDLNSLNSMWEQRLYSITHSLAYRLLRIIGLAPK